MIHLSFITGIERFIYKCHVITLCYIKIAMSYIYILKVIYLYIRGRGGGGLLHRLLPACFILCTTFYRILSILVKPSALYHTFAWQFPGNWSSDAVLSVFVILKLTFRPLLGSCHLCSVKHMHLCSLWTIENIMFYTHTQSARINNDKRPMTNETYKHVWEVYIILRCTCHFLQY